MSLAQGGVQEVDSGRPYGDTDLAGAGQWVVGDLVGEVLGGAEGMQTDGVHEEELPVSSGAPLFDLKRA